VDLYFRHGPLKEFGWSRDVAWNGCGYLPQEDGGTQVVPDGLRTTDESCDKLGAVLSGTMGQLP
jgi:hypothetical protein